jgi:hypothetical protein
METGPAGSQIQLEDPDGNPIELFEPADRQNGRSYWTTIVNPRVTAPGTVARGESATYAWK